MTALTLFLASMWAFATKHPIIGSVVLLVSFLALIVTP